MISLEKAKELARETVSALGVSCGYDLVLICGETIEVSEGWVFFYNSKEFIETRNPISALAGNGPIFVDRNGVVRQLPSAVPWEKAINA